MVGAHTRSQVCRPSRQNPPSKKRELRSRDLAFATSAIEPQSPRKCTRTVIFHNDLTVISIWALDRHGWAYAIESGRPLAAAAAIRFADVYGAFCGWKTPPADRYRSTRGSRMQDSRRAMKTHRPAEHELPLPASPEPSGLPPPRSGCQWPRARSLSTSPPAHHGQIARDSA
jgi:hypothetical protein